MESRKRMISTSAVFGLFTALLLAGLLSLAAAPQAHADGADADEWAKANANSTTIKPGKAYNRNCSKNLIHIFKFTSGGGKYKLKVSDKGGKKGDLFLSVVKGKLKSTNVMWLDPEKGQNTFDLGKIKKGTKVTIQFTNNRKSKYDKFSFELVGKKPPAKKQKYIYALVYGGAKGKDPSSTTNTRVIEKVFKKLKVPGYKVKKVNKVNKGSFSKEQFNAAVKSAFAKATKDDLCLVYLNTHSSKGKGIYISGGKSKGKHYKYKSLLDTLGKYTKGKIIFMPEVCYSGGFADAASGCNAKKRIAVLTATCSAAEAHQYQSSYDPITDWLTDCNRGAFTSALSRGLGGKPIIESGKANRLAADKNGDKRVTIKELYSFINSDSIVKDTNQQPQFYAPKSMKSLVLYKK